MLLLCLMTGPAAALSPPQYRAAVAGAVADARQAKTAAPEEAAALLRRARGRLPAATTVWGADGPPIRVTNQALAQLLDRAGKARSAAGRREAIGQFVEGGETVLAAMAPAPPRRTPAEAKALQQVLARSEFSRSPIESWEERLRDWLMQRLRSLFAGARPATLEAIARTLYYLFLGLLIVLLAYLIWTYVPGLRLRRRGRAARLTVDDAVAAPESADAHLAAADAAADAGRYLDALRHTYTAMLLRLDAANLVPFDRSRTNREVLRALQRGGYAPVRDLFLPVTLTLDEKLYGGRPATDEEYRGCRAAATRLEVLLAS
jgi:Domain of unknown function (DUF4129)